MTSPRGVMPKSHPVAIRLNASQYAAIQRLSLRLGINISNILRLALARFIEEEMVWGALLPARNPGGAEMTTALVDPDPLCRNCGHPQSDHQDGTCEGGGGCGQSCPCKKFKPAKA